MTPPGEYEDGSVGVPLPGIRARLTPIGELEIAGPLRRPLPGRPRAGGGRGALARHRRHLRAAAERALRDRRPREGRLQEHARADRRPGGRRAPARRRSRGEARLPRRRRPRPQRAARSCPTGPIPSSPAATPDETDAYFRQIVAAVNREVAPPERVVSFALLERDFDPEREMTAKGSFRRKEIEKAFARRDRRALPRRRRRDRVRRRARAAAALVPSGTSASSRPTSSRADGGLVDRRSGRRLAVVRVEDGRVRVGDLVYRVEADVVDLGLFARQPMLWAGNPQLRAFAPCKDGWDVPLRRVSPEVRASPCRRARRGVATPVRDAALDEAHRLSADALFAPEAEALAAVQRIAERLPHAEPAARRPPAPPPRGARVAPGPRAALPRVPDAAPRRPAARRGRPARHVRAVRPAVPRRGEHRRDRARPAGAVPPRRPARSGSAATGASWRGPARTPCASCSRTCSRSSPRPPASAPTTWSPCAPSSRRGRSSTATRSSPPRARAHLEALAACCRSRPGGAAAGVRLRGPLSEAEAARARGRALRPELPRRVGGARLRRAGGAHGRDRRGRRLGHAARLLAPAPAVPGELRRRRRPPPRPARSRCAATCPTRR